MARTIPKLDRFTVKRATWLRGEGDEDSRLLRPSDGKMCCLGHYCLAAGLAADDIKDMETPAALYTGHLDKPVDAEDRIEIEALANGGINSKAAGCLMEINDHRAYSDAEREATLTNLFASIGVAVTFED